MKVVIERKGDVVVAHLDTQDIDGRGELSHVICELERIKIKLLALWDAWKDE